MNTETLPEYGTDGTSMPRWKCHKEVNAFKIREIRMVGEPPTAGADQRAMLVSTDGGTPCSVLGGTKSKVPCRAKR